MSQALRSYHAGPRCGFGVAGLRPAGRFRRSPDCRLLAGPTDARPASRRACRRGRRLWRARPMADAGGGRVLSRAL